MKKSIVCLVIGFFLFGCDKGKKNMTSAAKQVIERIAGKEKAERFDFELAESASLTDSYSVKNKNGRIEIVGNSQVALCRGAYDYLSNACNSIVSWSGNRIDIPETLPDYASSVTTPYHYRYYFNVVTHGYTTVFWDWDRWEKEIDWMAVHGINMPLLGGAHEAILYRIFQKIGLTEKEISTYYTGPAFLPWNRMGNLTGWDGATANNYFTKQIALNHKILNRLKELGMHPIVPAFAGFVPEGMKRLYPDQDIRDVAFGAGFSKQYSGHILAPTSELFAKIGRLYIEEWEKEFGKNQFYLADSFNEMNVPLSADTTLAAKELAGFGNSVYQGIHQANPEATWVIQGWTFPFQKDKNGKLFWSPQRLNALVSEVPDDKLLILDLANEYNRLYWKTEPSWKIYSGFFGKKWIYSFIPNMGGKTALNGDLQTYASIPVEALEYKDKKNLVGFGFAPEGIDNNEIIYELLSDIGWSHKAIDLNSWIPSYCMKRYGTFPDDLKASFKFLLKSCYGSFTPHPRHRFQLVPDWDPEKVAADWRCFINNSEEFNKGVELFLNCKDTFPKNELFKNDAIELSAQFLGLKADSLLIKYKIEKNGALLEEAFNILVVIDRLLESHPNHRLQKWIDFARAYGDTPGEKNDFEADAKRLITSWGGDGALDSYAARTWSGLIRDYYIPRWKLYFDAKRENRQFDLRDWEEKWINTPMNSKADPFENPVEKAFEMVQKYK